MLELTAIELAHLEVLVRAKIKRCRRVAEKKPLESLARYKAFRTVIAFDILLQKIERAQRCQNGALTANGR
jgi:hypothetical protein